MGRPKIWLPFAEGSVLGTLLGTLARAGCDPLVVVTRAGQRLPPDALDHAGLRTVVNPAPEHGMLSSILAGLEALGGASELADAGRPLVVCPADHPAIEVATVRLLVQAVADGSSMAVPSYDGRRGHPLAVGAALVADIPRLDPAAGLRQLLDREPGALRELPVDDPGVIADLDTPDDYERLIAGR